MRLGLIFILFMWLSVSNCIAQQAINENWSQESAWEKMEFPNIATHTSYSIVQDENNQPIIKAETNASASGFVHKDIINVIETPTISWEWKVSNVYEKGDATKKSGDDYPARLYVMFQYDPEEASFFKRMRYDSIKMIYGTFPPDTTLNYIWANKKHAQAYIHNAYSKDTIMFLLQTGSKNVGTWQKETRNILNDYRTAYDKEPPKHVRIALMADSDNTGGRATSYFRNIKLSNMSR